MGAGIYGVDPEYDGTFRRQSHVDHHAFRGRVHHGRDFRFPVPVLGQAGRHLRRDEPDGQRGREPDDQE